MKILKESNLDNLQIVSKFSTCDYDNGYCGCDYDSFCGYDGGSCGCDD